MKTRSPFFCAPVFVVTPKLEKSMEGADWLWVGHSLGQLVFQRMGQGWRAGGGDGGGVGGGGNGALGAAAGMKSPPDSADACDGSAHRTASKPAPSPRMVRMAPSDSWTRRPAVTFVSSSNRVALHVAPFE